jgi:hypothetical protein
VGLARGGNGQKKRGRSSKSTHLDGNCQPLLLLNPQASNLSVTYDGIGDLLQLEKFDDFLGVGELLFTRDRGGLTKESGELDALAYAVEMGEKKEGGKESQSEKERRKRWGRNVRGQRLVNIRLHDESASPCKVSGERLAVNEEASFDDTGRLSLRNGLEKGGFAGADAEGGQKRRRSDGEGGQ